MFILSLVLPLIFSCQTAETFTATPAVRDEPPVASEEEAVESLVLSLNIANGERLIEIITPPDGATDYHQSAFLIDSNAGEQIIWRGQRSTPAVKIESWMWTGGEDASLWIHARQF